MTHQIVVVQGGRATLEVADDNDMVAASEFKIPTQKSVKAFAKTFITGYMADISTAESSFVVVPRAGTITKIYATIKNAVVTASAALSFELGGTAITDAGITITTGEAAGDVVASTPTALNTVAAGDSIEMITDGGSTDACECQITFEITPS